MNEPYMHNKNHISQVTGYLAITRLQLALPPNFKHVIRSPSAFSV